MLLKNVLEKTNDPSKHLNYIIIYSIIEIDIMGHFS